MSLTRFYFTDYLKWQETCPHHSIGGLKVCADGLTVQHSLNTADVFTSTKMAETGFANVAAITVDVPRQ